MRGSHMTKTGFRKLFVRALNSAAELAEAHQGHQFPRSFSIELHAPGAAGAVMSIDQAIDRLYLGPDRFFRVIDIAIKQQRGAKSMAFVRVSGHKPTDYSATWDPAGLGPFKQMIAEPVSEQGAAAC